MELSLKNIPFRKKDHDILFGFDKNKPDGNFDFCEHGYGIINSINLYETENNISFEFKKTLVIVIHSKDDPVFQKDDIEIGFILSNKDFSFIQDEIEVNTNFNKFIEIRINDFIEISNFWKIQNLVFSVCNPHSAAIKFPKIKQNINIFYPMGIVEHWKYNDNSYELRAKKWIKH